MIIFRFTFIILKIEKKERLKNGNFFGVLGLFLPMLISFFGNQSKAIKAAEIEMSKRIIELSENQIEFNMDDAIKIIKSVSFEKEIDVTKVRQRFERAGHIAFDKINIRKHTDFLAVLLTVMEKMPGLPDKIKLYDIIAFVSEIATCIISFVWIFSNTSTLYISIPLSMIAGCQVGVLLNNFSNLLKKRIV